jgi:hypothetical protein
LKENLITPFQKGTCYATQHHKGESQVGEKAGGGKAWLQRLMFSWEGSCRLSSIAESRLDSADNFRGPWVTVVIP